MGKRGSEHVDTYNEYGPLEGTDLAANAASIKDFLVNLLNPYQAGRQIRYFLTASIFPATRTWDASGQVSCPGNSPQQIELNLPTQMTSLEFWNYDTTNNVLVTLLGISRRPFLLSANSYYAMDISGPPQVLVRIDNNNGAAVNVQVKANGF